jgi:hypothetical protein
LTVPAYCAPSRWTPPVQFNSPYKLERWRTDDLPAMTPADFIGVRSVGGPGRPRQLFLEKAAGTCRGIEKQHSSGFGTGIFPGVRHIAWFEGTGARPADRNLVADLKGDFAAQYVRHLVAIAVKMECRLGPSRRGFFEQHDAVAGLAASSLSAAERPGAMLKIEPPPGGTIKPFLTILSQLLDQYSTGVVRAPDATDQRGRGSSSAV